MDIEKICSLVGQKYLLKTKVKEEDKFIKGIKVKNYDNNSLYEFIIKTNDLTDYEQGIILRLICLNLFNDYYVKNKKDLNNFVEKVSSIQITSYINLIKEKKQMVKPIKYNIVTIKTSKEYLKQKSTKLSFNDKNLLNYVDILKEYCERGEVLALAAIQLGIPKRIIYIKNTNNELIEKYQNKGTLAEKRYDELRFLINPKIIKQEGLTEYWEACASCLDNLGHVYRPYLVEIEYYDLKRQKHKQIFKGFESTILSHEYDHLEGILHMDKADQILNMNAQERCEFRKSHKYNIISRTGDYKYLLDNIKKERS